jgi:hypothetical protein
MPKTLLHTRTRSKTNSTLKKVYNKKAFNGGNIIFEICKKKNYLYLLKKYNNLNLDIFFIKDNYGNIPIFSTTFFDNYECLLYILKNCKDVEQILKYRNNYGCNLKDYLLLRNPNGECMKIIKDLN